MTGTQESVADIRARNPRGEARILLRYIDDEVLSTAEAVADIRARHQGCKIHGCEPCVLLRYIDEEAEAFAEWLRLSDRIIAHDDKYGEPLD